MATSNNAVIISRIQNRRGLKQDLPKPLRSGELGFATDTRQVYIGGDTDLLVNSDLIKLLYLKKLHRLSTIQEILQIYKLLNLQFQENFMRRVMLLGMV